MVYQDNLGAINWTTNVPGLRQVKDIGIKYKNVKESVYDKETEIRYVPSKDNKAECLNKVSSSDLMSRNR